MSVRNLIMAAVVFVAGVAVFAAGMDGGGGAGGGAVDGAGGAVGGDAVGGINLSGRSVKSQSSGVPCASSEAKKFTLINGRAMLMAAESFAAQNAQQQGITGLIYPLANGQNVLILAPNYRASGRSACVSINGANAELAVISGDYASENISVAPNYAAKKLSPKIAARVRKEAAQAAKIYASSSAKSYLRRAFVLPHEAKITSPFGSARLFNGELKSFHSGADFRAALGTPIRAANDGVVVLSADRFYAGGSVIIDHGHGVFTQYYHLLRRSVKVGDVLARGDLVGLSGASGRVSGPHFHLGVAVRGVSVDPLEFFEAFNKFLPSE